MGKFLFWAVVIIGVLLVTRVLTHYAANQRNKPLQKKGGPQAITEAEEMVRCAHCQVFIPRSDAFEQDDHLWCGPEHAKQGVHQPR
ncbi:MAG: PP0621 family protein [Orrella sp.]|jgi:uncharacterized protein|uniref:PP0621 family protein n=1 Tax=Orrella sp. TaxID=1921583 RepID=UPI002755B7E0|nr:PP0621 family protein [Burkholderiaceae bacterium]